MDIQSRNTIQCPLLPQLPTQTDFTVYWTIKNSSDGQSLDIIVAKFPDGEIMSIQKYTDTHSITDKNGLQVTRFGKRDEEYCCHVFENENDLRTACVDVTWLALMTQKHPSLEGCDSASQICNVEVTQHQDYLPLACYIHEVYPKPNLNWSYTNCERTPKFFTASTSTRNQTNESFNVKSTVYIVELKRSLELCSFTCTAYGDAITDQTRSSTVTIKRRNEITTTPSLRTPFTYTCPDCNESGFGVIVFLMVCLLVFDLGLFLLLVLPRSKAFLLNHALDFPTLPRFPRMCEFVLAKEKDSEPSGTQSSAQNPPTEEDETCLMISSPEESVMEQKEDPKFKWKYVGDLIIKSFLDMRNRSGFKAIKDVICMEDGNMVVIDEKGMHHFTTEYHYRFIDLDQVLNHKTFVCFTNFAYDKLLFGLKLGKIVVVDMAQEQATNFASVTPAKGKEVQLACIAGGDSGFVFASDRNGRTISVFDQGGICFGRFETPSIQPSSLAVHIRKGIPGFFVTTEMLVRKYNVSGEKRQSMISHEHHLNIDKDFLMTRDFKPGHISVQGNELLVINHLDDTKSLQILHLNVNNGKFQNSTIAHAPGIRGVKFSSGDKVILYTDNSVHLLEKRTD
ncbi:uncharacterized protein LOC110975072 isoform X2 [Acanthaster planci]|uniref:Uncharacterized protein LOC110975072 isoform X2 n=1 Tax=Acanthaster planci TaxID=133434 RepID=A0A8B7XSG4_ACAPL|nr:uncharacterized protein LOC110975072 isoform X2 [Acanthaster planci]